MAWQYAALAGLQIAQAQGQAATIRTQSDIQSQINQFNEKLAEYDAWQTENDGLTAVARYQNTIDQVEGTQRAMIYARGQNPNDSSLGEVVRDTQLTGVLNKMDISNQAYNKAQGYKREVSNIQLNDSFQHIQSNAQASAVAVSGYMAAAGTGLGYYKEEQKYDALFKDLLKKGGSTNALSTTNTSKD